MRALDADARFSATPVGSSTVGGTAGGVSSAIDQIAAGRGFSGRSFARSVVIGAAFGIWLC